VFLIWTVGGLLSLFGALGYAELASAYPEEGGDYVYLTRAFGPWAGFLFGWVQTAIVRPGDIAVMAFAFATYAAELWDPFESAQAGKLVYAGGAIVLLTGINIAGVREGKVTQNILTTVKALGLLGILVVALAAPVVDAKAEEAGGFPTSVALILVLFTFGGWNEMAYVAAEVKNPGRNIVRALVLGTVAVTVLYLLANAAFLHTLGYQGMAASQAVAADTVRALFPEVGGRLISALICLSALGAVNGLIFAGARISFAVGRDHRLFRHLGVWNARTGTPVRSLALQGTIALALVLALGSLLDTVIYTAVAVYSFYLATSLAVFVLRRKEPGVQRPFRVWGYPYTTLLFCITCGYLIYSAAKYAVQVQMRDHPLLSAFPYLILLCGPVIYWMTRRIDSGDEV
jgi:amino acid transporter